MKNSISFLNSTINVAGEIRIQRLLSDALLTRISVAKDKSSESTWEFPDGSELTVINSVFSHGNSYAWRTN